MGKQVRVTLGQDVFPAVVIGVVGDASNRTMGEVEYVTVRQLTADQSNICHTLRPDQVEIADEAS
jgi:hypothetical protein